MQRIKRNKPLKFSIKIFSNNTLFISVIFVVGNIEFGLNIAGEMVNKALYQYL